MAEQNTPLSPAPATIPEAEITALIKKHRAEIENVQGMKAEDQQEVFRQLGVDPKALESHYEDLERRAMQLRREDAAANKKVTTVGWTSFLAGAAATFTFTHVKKPDSKLVRWVSIAFAAPAASLLGTFTASRIFAGKIRQEGLKLAEEGRNAFERELAVALENREREIKAGRLPVTPPEQMAAQYPAPETLPSTSASAFKRDTSFAAQAAADKAASATSQVRT